MPIYNEIIKNRWPSEAAEILATECRLKDAQIAQLQNMLRTLGGQPGSPAGSPKAPDAYPTVSEEVRLS